jgi:hypothetical protein
MACEIPAPKRSISEVTSCSPVPAAATSPIGPARTRLANPSAAPPISAVPQSGPISSSPRSRARAFRSISCSTGTLSENSSTCRPASSASWATGLANRPGTEITASVASGSCRTADAIVLGR